MPNLVHSLDDPSARLPQATGSKGATLARMRATGLPVPPGFAITTKAFSLAGPMMPDHLAHELAATNPSEWETVDALAAQVRTAIAARGVPSEVAQQATAAYLAMGGGRVSVRSSATGEDLERASFAGLYDSFLNVLDEAQLISRILDVWVSLFLTRAVSYRLLTGIPNDTMAMAVVVQRLVDADASGVLFTRDPVTGSTADYWVNVTYGLGEGVVTGDAPADIIAIDKQTGTISSSTIADKSSRFEVDANGGITQRAVPNASRANQAMAEAELAELASLASKADALFPGEKDIEFVVQDGQVSLLQVRPVTAAGEPAGFAVEWESPEEEAFAWTKSTGPVYALQEDATRAYNEAAKVCFAETGVPMARNHFFKIANGYIYLHPPEVDDEEITSRQKRMRELDLRYVDDGSSLYEAEVVPEIERGLTALRAARPRGSSLPKTLAYLHLAMQQYAHVMGNLHWRMASGFRMEWPQEFNSITGLPPVQSGELLQGISHRTTRLVAWVRNLARMAQQDPRLRTMVEAADLGAIQAASDDTSTAFASSFQRMLARYGTRTGRGAGSTTDFTTPTWNMEPHHALNLIASFLDEDIERLEELERQSRKARIRATARIRRTMAKRPEQAILFDWTLARAVEDARRLENHNYLMEQGVAGVFREAVDAMGKALMSAGLVQSPDDVMHLRVSELEALASGQMADCAALIGERKREFAARAELRAPVVIGRGPVRTAPPRPGGPPPENAGFDGEVLRGVGASPGRVSGPARVALPSPTPPRVSRGDILVAQNAGPAWTPIFPLLGGIVLNEGAVFQHAALVAREYGIPAVIMTKDATDVIVDGQTIAVDAAESLVELNPAS